MAIAPERHALVGQNTTNLEKVQGNIAYLEGRRAENYASSSQQANVMLANITYSLKNDADRTAVAQSFNIISAIARKAPTSSEAFVACQNLMDQGVAVTIASTLLGLKYLNGSALPDTLLAAADLAKVSSEIRVQLQEAGIFQNAAIAMRQCSNAGAREAAALVMQSLMQCIVDDPACAPLENEPSSTSVNQKCSRVRHNAVDALTSPIESASCSFSMLKSASHFGKNGLLAIA